MSKPLPSHIDPDVEFGHVRETHHRFAVILLWWLIAVSASLLAMAIDPSRQFIDRVDRAWLSVMVDAEVDVLVRIGEILAYAGSVFARVPLVVGVAVWLGRRAAWDRLGVWLGAIVFSEVTLTLLKTLYGRARPPAALALVETSSSSFPSGHSVATTATVVALVYVMAQAGDPARHWFYVAALFAVLMAVSRSYLRVHWLSDVTVGVVVGTATAMASVWLVERHTIPISRAIQSMFGWSDRSESAER